MNNYYTWNNMMANEYFSIQPAEVKGPNNFAVGYWERILLTMLYSVFEFTLPADWDLSYFRLMMAVCGSVLALKTQEYGWIFSEYGVSEIGLYYRPEKFIVNNQFLYREYEVKRGMDCELIYAMDDRRGLFDLVRRHATLLGQIDGLIEQNLMICHNGYVLLSPDKKSADTVKEAYGRLTTGVPLVAICQNNIGGDRNNMQLFNPNIKSNYIVDDLLVARRNVINSFLTLIGIPTANYEKKERLSSAEVTRNDVECDSIVSIIEENIRQCFDKVNIISGLDLRIERRFDNATDIIRNAKL